MPPIQPSPMTHDSPRIEQPCSKDWSELEGTGSRRFCSQCQLHVVDGASMTKDAATVLIRESGGGTCMRLVRDEHGAPKFRSARESMTSYSGESTQADSTPPKKRISKARWFFGSGLLSTVLAACGPERKAPSPSPTTDEPTLPPQATDEGVEDALLQKLESMGYACLAED